MLAIAGVLAVFVGLFAASIGEDPSARTSKVLGTVAPEFSVPSLDGKEQFSSGSLAGKVIIVNFWNSWCIPCQQELPALKAFWAKHRDDGDVVLLGVLRDDTLAAARAAQKKDDMTWTLVDDPGNRLSIDFGTRGQPETYVIAPDGTVAASQLGPTTESQLEDMLERARS